jgi:hypothetical protein
MNLRRWNELAASDRSRVIKWLAQFGHAGGRAGYPAEIVN